MLARSAEGRGKLQLYNPWGVTVDFQHMKRQMVELYTKRINFTTRSRPCTYGVKQNVHA